MGILIQNDDDHKLYEFTLIVEYVKDKTLVGGQCQDCEMSIGFIDLGGDDHVFVPHFETLAIMHRDNDDAGNEDFTGYSCIRCGLGYLYSAERVLVDDNMGFISLLTELDGRV